MALADLDALRSAMLTGISLPIALKTPGLLSSNNEYLGMSLLGSNPNALSTPSTSVALSNRADFPSPVNGSGRAIITGYSGCDVDTNNVSKEYPTWLLMDRLVHQGGLDMNINTAQTTNLPTTALTRYTSGAGVMIGLQVYTAGGATNTVVSVSYTNQAGTSGHTGTVTFIDTPNIANFFWVGLQAGDSGVRSVESVTLSAATGITGNLGVVLFKPLAYLGSVNANTSYPYFDVRQIPGWNTAIEDGAYLDAVLMSGHANGATYTGHIDWSVV